MAHASTYTVYESKTSSSSGYSVVASGLITTAWTSGTLSAGSYWFEIAATTGTNWVSGKSTYTGPRVISSTSCS